MKVSGFALLILTLTFMILTKILVSNQENKISDIEERIKGIKKLMKFKLIFPIQQDQKT